jgi:hypothetical protein
VGPDVGDDWDGAFVGDAEAGDPDGVAVGVLEAGGVDGGLDAGDAVGAVDVGEGDSGTVMRFLQRFNLLLL